MTNSKNTEAWPLFPHCQLIVNLVLDIYWKNGYKDRTSCFLCYLDAESFSCRNGSDQLRKEPLSSRSFPASHAGTNDHRRLWHLQVGVLKHRLALIHLGCLRKRLCVLTSELNFFTRKFLEYPNSTNTFK